MKMIGERIKQRRIELGLSQDELAEKLQYKSRSSITKIEKGEAGIPANMIQEFASVLQTSPSYLFGWVNDPSEDWRNLSKNASNDRKRSMHYLFEAGLSTEQAESLMKFIKLSKRDQEAIMQLVSSLFGDKD